MKKNAAWALLIGCVFALPVSAQDFDPKLLDVLKARSIGPANMGGRICDIAVVEDEPKTMYVGFATGGVFKTTDGGESWTPIFDEQPATSIGAVAVAPSDPKVVWVGTGEANARNSVSWGDGVYKSIDGGKTWKHVGLKETHHVGRVIIHPKNPDVVYVAALGHVWGANKERGVFKTTDGGKTWEHSLALDDETGAVELAMDPSDPDIIYAAAFCVRRDGFCGSSSPTKFGPKAGIYKTVDAGKTWERLAGGGLPPGPFGRCGLSVCRKDPNFVYAIVETDKTSPATQGQPANLNTAASAGGVFRSADKGKTWKHLNSAAPRSFYFGQIRVDPNDEKRVYVLGVGLLGSTDGGAKFGSVGAGVHADQHAMWINPKDSKHIVLGNDGGLYFSTDRATTWQAVRGFAVGQFYGVAVDMRKPYRVYGGLQDNGTWGGPSATKSEAGITLNDWKHIGTNDGFSCQVDPTDANTVYFESQNGKLVRMNVSSGQKVAIGPKATGVRYNWSTPMLLSPHNAKTMFYAGQYVFRSDDRGDTWKTISPDLTRGADGKKAGHTITTIAESPKKAGVIYAGTDDGRLHVTRDAGKTWTDLSEKVLPDLQDGCISRVECSHHDEGTAYVTISRHRNDDRSPYVFKTTDFGGNWKSIASNLPKEGPTRVIRESSRNKDLLFLGTEFALFVSLDGGGAWHRLGVANGLPIVPIHDLVIHPRDRDLVIGTHGRSVYVMPIGPLEELSPKVLASDAHVFDIPPARSFAPKPDPMKRKSYVAPNPPIGAAIHYYLKNAAEAATITVVDKEGNTHAKLKAPNQAGLNQAIWNLRPEGDGAPVPPGDYILRLEIAGKTIMKPFRVEALE